jgi:hypothetical protein
MAKQDNPNRETKDMSPDDLILVEAKKRWKRCETYERTARINWVNDRKFANGDSDNHWQWEETLRKNRELDDAPCLTINKVRQHNLQIINDGRQNKPSVSIKGVGNGATYDAAQVFEGLVRHIEYISNAQAAYDTASTHQVEGGIGYWRILTDYADDSSFDQEIFIGRIKNPLSVYLDPDIKEADGSDAMFGFVFDDIDRDVFDAKYPKFKDKAAVNPLGNAADASWINGEKVRIAEYFRRVGVEDELIAVTDPETGERHIAKLSELDPDAGKALNARPKDDPDVKRRPITTMKVEHYTIVGDSIADRKDWAGQYIPIVRVIGEEIEIDGEMDRWGHTRAMKDPQRIYNYWSSSAVEMVALQSKTPYIGAMSAFENLEAYWDTANTVNHAWLPFNEYDDKGQKISAPQRQAPPVMAQAYIQGMSLASDDLRATSGQYQSEMGMPGNETSGKAINARQRQGDNATYHYIDNLADAIRYTGKQLMDLIPKIYDTPRVIKILGEDGKESEIQIDPKAQAAYAKEQQQAADKVSAIFNPNVGKYSVQSDIGPAYATKRQEAFNAMTQIATSDKQFLGIAGDIYFENGDFPGAQAIAERYSRIVPAAVKGEAPSPEVQQMQAQIKGMQDAIAALNAKYNDKQQEIDIRGYEATTKRLVAVGNSGPQVSLDQAQPLIQEVTGEMLNGGPPVQQEQAPQAPQQSMPPIQGLPQ